MNKKASLSCSKCGKRNYTTMKNQSNSTERLSIKKYCSHCNEHVLHQETK